jgi:hypothetical protein
MKKIFFLASALVAYTSSHAQEAWIGFGLGVQPGTFSQEPLSRIEFGWNQSSSFGFGIQLVNAPNGMPSLLDNTFITMSRMGIVSRYQSQLSNSFRFEVPVGISANFVALQGNMTREMVGAVAEGGLSLAYTNSRFDVVISERYQQSIGIDDPAINDKRLSGLQTALEIRFWLPTGKNYD